MKVIKKKRKRRWRRILCRASHFAVAVAQIKVKLVAETIKINNSLISLLMLIPADRLEILILNESSLMDFEEYLMSLLQA